ncbi:MAG: hypothetical protein IPQ09_16240 [Myxococcales bacterium]|nr:hypothetical protein [Myxococcales bacterium]
MHLQDSGAPPFRLARATEGQLLLERRVELAGTFVRVGAFVQVACVAFSALAADRLSLGIRGAMCGYGVFQASPWGFLAARRRGPGARRGARGAGLRVRRADAHLRARAAARALHGRPRAARAARSRALDALSARSRPHRRRVLLLGEPRRARSGRRGRARADGPRAATTLAALVAIVATLAVGALAARRPSRGRAVLAGRSPLAALPFAVGAAMLEVAPHAFEVPQHVCPFCLLKPEVLALGYPLFGAMFVGATWAGGAALGAALARSETARATFAGFAREASAPPRTRGSPC